VPLGRPLGRGEERSPARRMADALVDLAGGALDSGTLPQSAGQRPHLQVTCSLETLGGQEGCPAGRLEGGGLIAAATVERLACDAGITRMVFAA